MSLSGFAIQRPVLTTLMSLAWLVLGWQALHKLPVELYPNVVFPIVTVTTVYPGAAPLDVEQQITNPLEEALAQLPQLERIRSQSREHTSIIVLQFALEAQQERSLQHIQDRLSQVTAKLPQQALAPQVMPFALDQQPVLTMAISHSTHPHLVQQALQHELRPLLQNVPGVGQVRLQGIRQPQIRVDVDSQRLRQVHLDMAQLVQLLQASHLSLPVGQMNQQGQTVGVRLLGELASLTDLQQLIVGIDGKGQRLHLQDIAKIDLVDSPLTPWVRLDGEVAMGMDIIQQPGANTIAVNGAVRQQVDQWLGQQSPGYQVQWILDQSLPIQANAHEVTLALVLGGLAAVAVILLFLLDLKGTLIAALALPISVLGAIGMIWLLGFSLNQLTLLALALAIGLLIDDAVVVRESITKRLELGDPPLQAALRGTHTISLAVTATTLTLVAVFVPVALMKGLVGRFFYEFGITIAVAVLLSLWVALTLDPMLSAHWLGASHLRATTPSWLAHWTKFLADALAQVTSWYQNSLGWVLAAPVITVSLGLIIVLLAGWSASNLGADFLIPDDRNQLVVELQWPPDQRLETLSAQSLPLEQAARRVPGVQSIYALIGAEDQSDRVIWRVGLEPKATRSNTMTAIKQQLRELLRGLSHVQVAVLDPPMLEGIGAYPPIWYHVTGDDLQQLEEQAALVGQILTDLPGVADVHVQSDPGRPELHLQIHREQAAQMGMPLAWIGQQIRHQLQEHPAGHLRLPQGKLPIIVRMARTTLQAQEQIQQLHITTPKSDHSRPISVPIGQVVQWQQGKGPACITHEQGQRQIGITAQLQPGADLRTVTQAFHQAMPPLPKKVALLVDGQQKDMEEMGRYVLQALGIALLLMYVILAVQFESFCHPWTVLLSLPLAGVGAVAALVGLGHTLAIGSIIGIVLLLGLVTKNGILLIDGALQAKGQGYTSVAAMAHAAPLRFRPVVMTSCAMVLGMLPTALGDGMGSEFRQPMAWVVIGGVLTSTVLTLWLVPALFVLVEKMIWIFRTKA